MREKHIFKVFTIPDLDHLSYSQLTHRPIHSCLSQGRDLLSPSSGTSPRKLPVLRDMDQPFTFEIRMYNRPYRFEFFDNASPTNYTLLLPDMVVLCYDVTSHASLRDVQERWRKEILVYYRKGREERMPIALVGLKRDLRDARVAEQREYVDPMEVCEMSLSFVIAVQSVLRSLFFLSSPPSPRFSIQTVNKRPTESLKKCAAIATRNVPP